LDQIRDKLNKSLSRVRQNALNIADSFDIPDRILCSVLGRRDGHIWENLMKWAERSELNKTSVLPFHHQTLGKLMRDQQLNSKL
jgi:acyl-CoA oxidase